MAFALAKQYCITAKDSMMHSMRVASPTREYVPGSSLHDTGIKFIDLVQGLQESDVIILAIPGKAMAVFIEQYADYMKESNKLIIDINNDPSAHEAETFNKYDLRWVKGFNDVGAIDLLSRKNKKSKPKTRISGRDIYAVDEARKFAESALGFDVAVVEHHKRKATEQESLGKEWKHATYVAFFLYLAYLAVVTTHYYKRWPFPYEGYKWPTVTQNKIVSCVSVSLFALSVMPGTIARLIKSWKNDSLYALHPSILWALSIRKHLGLLGLYFLFVHAVMSLINFGPGNYYWFAYDSTDSLSMNLTGEVSMMFAVYSTSLFIIVGLASLPSVGEAMNKAQWAFIFGPVVWLALAMGHAHYCVIYFRAIMGTREMYGGIPHATLLGSLLPWFAFFLKFLQLVVTYGLAAWRKLVGTDQSRRASTTMPSGFSKQFSISDGEMSSTDGSNE